jgi:ribose 5-phosphate isomerase B
MMRIAIGSDHGGYELKEAIIPLLVSEHIEIIDVGTHSADSVDYPDFAQKVAHEVLTKSADFGIAMCGTGIGISIAANKIKGIRAALVYDENTAHLAKAHNNANIIAIGGRTTSVHNAIAIINSYIHATYEPRHQTRIHKIHELEGADDE